MECVAIVTCQIRMPDGAIRFFNAGDVEAFDECPPHFEPIAAREVDFVTASEAELMAAKWTLKEANTAMENVYGVQLKRASKAELVNQILDIRFRHEPKPRG